ncbi:MAG: NAD(P)H-dependent oxidoreductase subunit E [Deltaproteobacteria bacterium]|nr:NAD(P)H-dependent oxidoreductase subunit E [Deltaproteobacteria bacterium]
MPTSREATVERVRSWIDKAVLGSGRAKKRGRDAVIPLLQAAQAEFGYVPRETIDGIARALRLPSAIVQGIATFYAQFRFSPPGRHTVTVCRGTACHVRGSGKLLDELSALLKVKPQETTADGTFTMETVACFGSCALAPVMVVDGKVYGRQTPTTAFRTLQRVRKEDKGSAAKSGRGRASSGRRSAAAGVARRARTGRGGAR